MTIHHKADVEPLMDGIKMMSESQLHSPIRNDQGRLYLVNLAEHAKFKVNINSVLGSGVKNPRDAQVIAERAVSLGFTSTVGIIHDHSGKLG